MNQLKYGGPAFPCLDSADAFLDSGMTLRDYFAGQAIIGLIINPKTLSEAVPFSARAYEIADNMLREREK